MIISCGFIFHRERQKKEYQRLQFFFTSIVRVHPEAAVSVQSKGVEEGEACVQSVFSASSLIFYPFFFFLLSKRFKTVLCATSDFLIFLPK